MTLGALGEIGPIILLEDDPNDAFFVRHALETARIHNPLSVFASANQAREHFLSQPEGFSPVLIILDLNLSGPETGLELLRWIREQREPLGSTSALILTVSDSQRDREESNRLGAMIYLQKPVTEEHLSRAVQALGFVVVNNITSGHLGIRTIERLR